jgi:hypothetical protein
MGTPQTGDFHADSVHASRPRAKPKVARRYFRTFFTCATVMSLIA